MTSTAFKNEYKKLHAWVEKSISELSWANSTVAHAAAYSLGAGGKRLRPVLTLIAAGQKKNKMNAMPMAVAIECVHTFSLIHDDLPCIDNSPLRRGKPSCHKAWGEAAAVLAGDMLLNKAFQIVAQNYPAEMAGKLTGLIAQTTEELIEGEWADIAAEKLAMKKVDLDYIYIGKTARMIGLPIAAGLTLAGMDAKTIKEQTTAAEKVGIAFQLVDDILDECGDAKKLGKKTAQDEKKKTFLKKYGREWTEKLAQRLSEEAIATFQKLPQPAMLLELTQMLLKRDR